MSNFVSNENATTLFTKVKNNFSGVDERFSTIFETGTTASRAIDSETYFYLDGVLVKSIAAIASGDTFTLNTNYISGDNALNRFKIMTETAYNQLQTKDPNTIYFCT